MHCKSVNEISDELIKNAIQVGYKSDIYWIHQSAPLRY